MQDIIMDLAGNSFIEIEPNAIFKVPVDFELNTNEVGIFVLDDRLKDIGLMSHDNVFSDSSKKELTFINGSNKIIAFCIDEAKHKEATRNYFNEVTVEFNKELDQAKSVALKDDMKEFTRLSQVKPPTYSEWIRETCIVVDVNKKIGQMFIAKEDV